MKKKYLKTLVYIISILIIISLGRISFINHFFNKKETLVPNVLYLDEKEAISLIKKSKLKYKIIKSKSSEVRENHIFIQDPMPDSVVKVNRTILIWSNKSDGIEIPNIIGKNLIEARRFLEDLNISIERIDYMPLDDIKEDTVLSIYPKVGSKVGFNQKISILVSSKSLVSDNIMPNLIGIDKNEAIKILAQINQSIHTISEAKDPSFPQNAIIATNPEPNSKINKNTKISIVLNTGIEVEKSITEIIEENTEKKEEIEDVETILNDTLKNLKEKENKNSEGE